MSDEALDPELNALETGLQALAPRTPAINRDQLLFLAGRASARRRTAGWRAWAVGSTLAAAGLGLALCLRPAPERVEAEVRWLPAPVEQPSSSSDSPGFYGSDEVLVPPHFGGRNEPYGQMQLRRLAFENGVDALPRVSSAESDTHYPVTVEEPPSVGSRIWWQLGYP
jgi:hypothetical protein